MKKLVATWTFQFWVRNGGIFGLIGTPTGRCWKAFVLEMMQLHPLSLRQTKTLFMNFPSYVRVGKLNLKQTIPETNSSHLKTGGRETILSFWVSVHIQELSMLALN